MPAPKASSDPESAAEASADSWQDAVYEAGMIAKARNGQGGMPGRVKEALQGYAQAQHDWREQLRDFIDDRVAKTRTWQKPSRRFSGASFSMPGSRKDGIAHLAWLIDTSGSMDIEWLKLARAEIQQALDEKFIDRITVVLCDTDIKAVYEYEQGEDVDFQAIGRGGTKFAPAFNWIRDSGEEYSAIVYLTDLEVYSETDFGKEPDCPVLWAVYGAMRYRKSAPFGEICRLGN